MPERTGERPSLAVCGGRLARAGCRPVYCTRGAARGELSAAGGGWLPGVFGAEARLDRVMSAPPAAAAGFAAAAAAASFGSGGAGPGAEPAPGGYPYYPSPPDTYYSLQGWGYPADMSPSEYSPPPPQHAPPAGYAVLPPGQYPPEVYGGLPPAGWDAAPPRPGSRGPTVKPKRGANKKERRRTMSINNAFAELRECIPNVPPDTKLSKIKTLRMATDYIAHLSAILQCDAEAVPEFKPEFKKTDRNDDKRKLALLLEQEQKANGRTGWPQHVWALELK